MKPLHDHSMLVMPQKSAYLNEAPRYAASSGLLLTASFSGLNLPQHAMLFVPQREKPTFARTQYNKTFRRDQIENGNTKLSHE
jgi:hypothetical protein